MNQFLKINILCSRLFMFNAYVFVIWFWKMNARSKIKQQQNWFTIYWQLESYINETKRKQTEIFDYKKRLADAEIKYRQHQTLFDALRVERNLCNRSLVEAQEQVRDLKSKLKITSQQIEQLKEDIAIKEANLVKEEFRKLFQ